MYFMKLTYQVFFFFLSGIFCVTDDGWEQWLRLRTCLDYSQELCCWAAWPPRLSSPPYSWVKNCYYL